MNVCSKYKYKYVNYYRVVMLLKTSACLITGIVYLHRPSRLRIYASLKSTRAYITKIIILLKSSTIGLCFVLLIDKPRKKVQNMYSTKSDSELGCYYGIL